MVARLVKRSAIVFAAMFALVTFTSGQAHASDAYLILTDSDGRQIGYMVHLDSEPDRIKVCDTQRDGYSVTGRILRDGSVLATTTDGMDSGCNYVTVDLRQNRLYWMEIWWNGPGNVSNYRSVVE
ncbi:hypothetical protein GCM10029992_18560 [Glycomyces albus]